MPRVASLLGLGLIALLAARAAAQYPAQNAAPQPWGDRPVNVPQIPWTGGTSTARPIEPPQLLPYQQSAAGAPTVPREILPVANQQPIALPLTRRPAGGPAPLLNKKLQPMVTGAASLGIVLGLFLLVVWSVRRGMPQGAGLLPAEAVEVLGRAPIAGRQNVHLVRCGNKIVLLNVSATSVETLTEISDPDEVERLYELCRHSAAPASAWQGLLSRMAQGAGAQGKRPEQIDFRHLEVGNHPRA